MKASRCFSVESEPFRGEKKLMPRQHSILVPVTFSQNCFPPHRIGFMLLLLLLIASLYCRRILRLVGAITLYLVPDHQLKTAL